jgi:hypothetical protein
MKMPSKKIIITSVIGLTALLSSAVNAAIINISPTTSPFVIDPVNKEPTSVTYSPLALQIIYSDDAQSDINQQSPANIGVKVEQLLNTVGSVTLASSADINNGGTAGSFSSSLPYNFLALHFGNNELLFDFGDAGIVANQAFSISGLPFGISNWRAYSGDSVFPNPNPAPVPVPAAIWLFGSALASLGMIGIRKQKLIA